MEEGVKKQQQIRRAEKGSGGRNDRLRARASGDEEVDEGGGSWRVDPGRWSRFGKRLKTPPAHWLQELCFQALTVICKYNLMNKLALCVCVSLTVGDIRTAPAVCNLLCPEESKCVHTHHKTRLAAGLA